MIGFSYVDIIIFAGNHVANGGPVKCGNLEEILKTKKSNIVRGTIDKERPLKFGDFQIPLPFASF